MVNNVLFQLLLHY